MEKMMYKTCVIIPLIVLLICAFSVHAQNTLAGDELFSPAAALVFYDIAHDMADSGSEKADLSEEKAEQALIFLTAATMLDNQADYVLPDMLKVACHTNSALRLGLAQSFSRYIDVNDPNKMILTEDNSALVKILLKSYVNSSADLYIVNEAVRYLLGQLDTREQREETLAELLSMFRDKNSLLESHLATSLGLLSSERADFERAQSMFLFAVNKSRYNRLAFEKLAELSPQDGIRPATYLEQLRFNLGENPLDLQAALGFAGFAQQNELFDIATDAYEYCGELYEYLYPGQPLPQYIYLPQALNAYSGPGDPHKVMQIAQKIRETGVVDIILETVAGKAAYETGENAQAESILGAAELKVLEQYTAAGVDRKALAEQLAWFYCFGKIEPGLAIDWANKAYANDPNSPAAAALLAYAFVLNDQAQWAQSFVDNSEPSIILNLVKAKLNSSAGQDDTAIEALKQVIVSAPESIEAGIAREMLDELGTAYISESDPKLTLSVLRASFPTNTVPEFLTPEKIVQVQLKLRGNEFSYGSDFRASIIITNRSDEPILISDYSLLQGDIRIDAVVRGDLNKTIPNLISKKIRPSEIIDPDSSLIVPVQLLTGQLKRILKRYPQASLEIEFKVYVDAVTLADGTIANRLEDIKPVVTTVQRQGVKLTSQFLRNRMNSLKRQRQSHQTAELFAGLLLEQQLMAGSEPLYDIKSADWMPDILRSGLSYNLTSDDWSSRVTTMSTMLDLPLDFELIEAASENLNNENWPVRLMSVYLLGKNDDAGFSKVLDHTAKYDENNLVRDMAVALGAKAPID